jgi:hypothetical protein
MNLSRQVSSAKLNAALSAWWKALQLSLLRYKVYFWTWIVFPQPMIIASLLPYKVSFWTWIVFPQPMMLALGEAYQ